MMEDGGHEIGHKITIGKGKSKLSLHMMFAVSEQCRADFAIIDMRRNRIFAGDRRHSFTDIEQHHKQETFSTWIPCFLPATSTA